MNKPILRKWTVLHGINNQVMGERSEVRTAERTSYDEGYYDATHSLPSHFLQTNRL